MLAAPFAGHRCWSVVVGHPRFDAPGVPAAVSALLSLLLVLLVADLFQPLDILAIHHIRDRDMAHTVGSGSAVPVFDTRRGPDHVARLDFPFGATLFLYPSCAGGDDQELAGRMRVPGRARARRERNRAACRGHAVLRLEQR